MVALEHTLVILLLLTGLLNAQPKIPRLAWSAIVAALALALIAPATPMALPWKWLSALLIPLLLWQAARRLLNARMVIKAKETVIWAGMALGMGGVLLLASDLTVAGALMFGLLAASMVWRATEEDRQPTHLGQMGPLALAFLLTEIAPAIEAPGRYLIALLAGAGIGALVGYIAVQTATNVPQGLRRDLLSIGQVYLSYGIATLFDLSGVAAAMLSVAVFVAYGTKRGLWVQGSIRPKPLDTTPVFILAVLALALFAWQTHVPLTTTLLLEISLGLLFTALVIWVGRRMKSEPFLPENSFPKMMLRVGFLLVPAILLWPRQALLDPLPMLVALIAAILATLGTELFLTPLLSLYDWLEDETMQVANPDELIQALLVRDLMQVEFATITTSTPVPEIARLFTENHMDCLPVLNPQGNLVGIVTEHDLFVKEERLPRTDRTYQAVFSEPVIPEHLPKVYAQKGATYTAADVMSTKVVWVKENSTLGQAVQSMVRYGYKCLPVLDAAPEVGGKLKGVITRSAIVSLLTRPGSLQAYPSKE
jgi:CBS domain-containing protein